MSKVRDAELVLPVDTSGIAPAGTCGDRHLLELKLRELALAIEPLLDDPELVAQLITLATLARLARREG